MVSLHFHISEFPINMFLLFIRILLSPAEVVKFFKLLKKHSQLSLLKSLDKVNQYCTTKQSLIKLGKLMMYFKNTLW